METRQPQYFFDQNRLVIHYELNKNPVNTDDYCDSEDFMRQIDPRVLYKENDPARQKRVEERISQYEDFSTQLIEYKIYYILGRLDQGDTNVMDNFWGNRKLPSVMIYYLTSFMNLRDYCLNEFPEGGSPIFYDNCVLAHTNERGNINAIPHEIYGDF